MKNTNINDLLVQGSKWCPKRLSALKKEDNGYADKGYNAVKAATAKEIIASCDKDGNFLIDGHVGKVLGVYVNKIQMDFAEYLKKYDLKPREQIVVPTISSAYQFM